MSDNDTTFWTGVWGAATGTAALLIQYISYAAERSRLKVAASMCIGTDARFGGQQTRFMKIQITNSGQGLIRVRSFCLSTLTPNKYKFFSFLNRFRRIDKQKHTSVGIYTGTTDPIEDILANPSIKSYPPKAIILEAHETKELRIEVAAPLLSYIPDDVGLLIVEDHIGRKRTAKYVPIKTPFRQEKKVEH